MRSTIRQTTGKRGRRAGLALIVLTTALPSIACLTPADARSDGGRRDAGKSQEGQGTTPAPNPGRDAGGSDATSTPEVSSPASGSSDGGGGALMPPTTPAMMPDAGQPGGPPASTPTSMTANLIFKDQPLFCLDVVNFPKDIILRTTSCAERALGQSFLVGSDNRFRFPASTFTSGDGVTYVAGSYCLSSDENANPQATSTQVPTLEICDPSDNAQKWEKRGSVLATVGNRCMTLTKAASADGFIIGLEGCQPEAANQGWIVGSPKDHAPARVMFVSNADKNSCVRVLDFPADPSVRWENCDGRDDFNHDRKFLLGTDGRFRYPATRSVIDKGKVYPVGSQCLTASNGSPAISLLPCDPAARNQVWSRDNDAIKSLGTGLCLSRSDGSEHVSLKFPELKLQPCVVSDVLQSWTLGDYWTMELARIQAAKAAPPSLDIACKPPSVIKFIDRDPNTALVQKIRGLFGGEAALRTLLSNAYEGVCRIMYAGRTEEKPVRNAIHVVFRPSLDNGLMNYSRYGGISVINVNDGAALGVGFGEAAVIRYLTEAFNHELAHGMQHFNGIPQHLIEGGADWVVFQKLGMIKGYIKAYKGGSLADGYARVAFFFDWLRTKYPSSTDARPLYLRLNSAARAAELQGKEWNAAWFVEQTGKTVDALWAEYQATFP